MRLSELLDLEDLYFLIRSKYVSRQSHPEIPGLAIYNYTHAAAYDGLWTPETKTCRGLIVQHEITGQWAAPDGEIVARPWKKFFNYGEHLTSHEDIPLNEGFVVKEKADGSLGIIYMAHETPCVATRGSFTSDQAQWATKHLQGRYGDYRPPPGTTVLVEIIAPWNRIVLDYGDMEDLIYLGTLDNETGRQVPDDSWPGPRVKEYRFDSLEDLQGHLAQDAENQEGFVVTFDSGLMVKFKYETYVKLHRILTGLSERRIWEHISTGGKIEDFVDGVPDEFFAWVHEVDARLRMQHDLAMEGLRSAAETLHLRNFPTRKDLAVAIMGHPDKALLFRAYDGQWDRVSEMIWKSLKPVGNVTFREDDAS